MRTLPQTACSAVVVEHTEVMSGQSDKRYVVIEPGAEAFVFTEHVAAPPARPDKEAPIPARIMAELRGFLPTVRRIRPMEARLQSGQKLTVYAPPV